MLGLNFNSLFDLANAFDTEEKCIEYLEELIWKGNPVSPFDPDSKVYKYANNQYRCKNTGKYFNITYSLDTDMFLSITGKNKY
jgi:hypothetical protein